MTEVIRVVVVDSSPQRRCLLTSLLDRESDMQVVGTTHQGAGAVTLVEAVRPHVVILALELADGNGLTILDHIMHDHPRPVVVVCGLQQESAMMALKAVHMGAVDFLQWNPEDTAGSGVLHWEITEKIRTASRIHVIRSVRSRRSYPALAPMTAGTGTACKPQRALLPNTVHLLEEVVVIGASTGGPMALRKMLSVFPGNYFGAIVIVQHMPEGFTAVLAAQLDRYTAIAVREADHGCCLEPGTALVAPGGSHLLLGSDSRVKLTKDPAVDGHRPSIDVTMRSLAHVYGARTQGVVLTGMGADGAKGLQVIHAKGGRTFAQDAASCVVDGMPKRAKETGIVDYIDTPVQIARCLVAVQK